jgi:hypothetical protein
VFNHTIQPTSPDDPKIVMENDFVLQAKGNKVYFLTNVPKSMKTKAVNKDVRVYGKVKENEH